MNNNLKNSPIGIIPPTLNANGINGQPSAPDVQSPCMSASVCCQSEIPPESPAPLSESFPSAHAAAAPAFTFISSSIGFGPLVPVSSSLASSHGPMDADAECLLDGFGRLLRFLLDAEMDYLCGVPPRARSMQRINYRGGYRERKLRTSLGTITLRTPFLRYLHPRVSIAKRAKRLSPDIFAQLVRIHATGATTDAAAALIKTIWTVTLSDEFLATLAANLTPILEEWRKNSEVRTSGISLRSEQEPKDTPSGSQTLNGAATPSDSPLLTPPV